MPRLKKSSKGKQARIVVLIGILFLIIGAGLWGYSLYAINEREQILKTGTLTIEEVGRWTGSLIWWKNAYTKIFLPLSIVFVVLGIAVLASRPLTTRLRKKRFPKLSADTISRPNDRNNKRLKIEPWTYAYRLFGKRIKKIIPYFKDLHTEMKKAGIKINFPAYLSFMVLASIIAFVVPLVLLPLLLPLILGTSYFDLGNVALSVLLASLSAVITLIIIYVYPGIIAATVKFQLKQIFHTFQVF